MSGSPKHLRFLRTLPCAHCQRTGPSEAHHSTAHRAGKGMKANDLDAFPLCGGPRGCHRQFHDATGSFRSWDKAARRLWQRSMVTLYAPKDGREQQSNDGEDGHVDPGGEPF